MTFVLFLLQKWVEIFWGDSLRLVTIIVVDTDYKDGQSVRTKASMQDVSIVRVLLVVYINS